MIGKTAKQRMLFASIDLNEIFLQGQARTKRLFAAIFN